MSGFESIKNWNVFQPDGVEFGDSPLALRPAGYHLVELLPVGINIFTLPSDLI